MSLEELDKSADNLVKDYQKGYIYILNRLKYQIDNGLSESQSRSLLNEIESELKRLNGNAKAFSKDVFPEYYKLALQNIDADALLLSGVNVIGGSQAVIHREAIKVAANSLYADLAKNTRFMGSQAKKIIRENGKELINRQVISGESQRKTKKALKEALIKNGVSSFIDNGGKQWQIDKYASMLVRTKSRLIHNEGLENRLTEYSKKYPTNLNFDLIQISSHGSTCWCGKFEGTVWSISGKHPDYPSITQLPNYPYKSFHPNCKHVWTSYMIELNGKGKKVDKSLLDRTIKDLNKEHYHAQKA